MLLILIPHAGTDAAALIHPKSAIVARDDFDSEGQLLCYYEGNTFGAINLRDYRSRLDCAAGRLLSSYPTSAMGSFEANSMTVVGIYDEVLRYPSKITMPSELKSWCLENANEILGSTLPAGPAAWSDASRIGSGKHTQPLIGRKSTQDIHWFLTAAHQVVCFDTTKKSAIVFDHSDPRLAELLVALELSEDTIRLVFGDATATENVATTGTDSGPSRH